MANTILHKRNSITGTAPTTGQLTLGELAVNTYDGKLYMKKDDGAESVIEIGGGALTEVVQDTTPQLGGDLDTNGFNIITETTTTTAVDSITLVGGDTTSGSSGNIFITTGASTSTNSGYFFLNGGTNLNTIATTHGGGHYVYGGSAPNGAAGGVITMYGGEAGGGTAGSNSGGDVTIYGGDGTAGSKAGHIGIGAGSSADQHGGDCGLFSGACWSGDNPGGELWVFAGRGSTGGSVKIEGGLCNGAGDGGNVEIKGGAAGVAGGEIIIKPGTNGNIGMHSNRDTVGEASIRLWKDTDTAHTTGNYVELAVPATLAADITLTLPPTDGNAGDIIESDGSGNLSFVAPTVGVENPMTSDLVTSGYNIITANTTTTVANSIGITSGSSTDDAGTPGGITLTGGDATSTSTWKEGGNINLYGGETTSSNGGRLTMYGGPATTVGGTIYAGAVYMRGGTATNDNVGGGLYMYGGSTTDGASGNRGGNVTLMAGSGYSTNKAGGQMFISSGTATDGTAGNVIIQCGATTGTAGNVTITAGSSLTGGTTTLKGGQGSVTGGDIVIAGGTGTSTTGGNVILQPGASSGTDGTIEFHVPTLETGEASIQIWKDTDTGHTTGNYVALAVPATLAADITLTLPDTDGNAGDVMESDGSGNLSFVAPSASGAPIILDVPESITATNTTTGSWSTVNNTTLGTASATAAILRFNIQVGDSASTVSILAEVGAKKTGTGDASFTVVNKIMTAGIQTPDNVASIYLSAHNSVEVTVNLDAGSDFDWYSSVAANTNSFVDIILVGYYV